MDSIVFPSKPWDNGETFEHTTSDGRVLVGTYNSAKNVWTFGPKVSGDEETRSLIFTAVQKARTFEELKYYLMTAFVP